MDPPHSDRSLTLAARDGAASVDGASSPETPADAPDRLPLAYLITVSCYGAHLHGDADGSIDWRHNIPGTPFLATDGRREAVEAEHMRQPPYQMEERRRGMVLEAIQEVCAYRGWSLLAAHVRTRHVHVVVHAAASPERVMNDLKAYSSRKLNEAGVDDSGRKRWARHGSTLYLWREADVEAAIAYVVREQGAPMAAYENVTRALGEDTVRNTELRDTDAAV